MSALAMLPAELHAMISSGVPLPTLLNLRESCTLFYHHECLRSQTLKELHALDEETKTAAQKCEKWAPAGSGLLLATGNYEPSRNRHVVENWLAYAQTKGISSVVAKWAADRKKMRLCCDSCVAMKPLAAFPQEEVRSRRKDKKSVSWVDIRRWNPDRNGEQTRGPSVKKCGKCIIKAGHRGWLPLGPFGHELIIRCKTCSQIKRMASKHPGCTKWLLQGQECLECHLQRPEYQQMYEIVAREEAFFMKEMRRLKQRLGRARGLLKRPAPVGVQAAERVIGSWVQRKGKRRC